MRLPLALSLFLVAASAHGANFQIRTHSKAGAEWQVAGYLNVRGTTGRSPVGLEIFRSTAEGLSKIAFLGDVAVSSPTLDGTIEISGPGLQVVSGGGSPLAFRGRLRAVITQDSARPWMNDAVAFEFTPRPGTDPGGDSIPSGNLALGRSDIEKFQVLGARIVRAAFVSESPDGPFVDLRVRTFGFTHPRTISFQAGFPTGSPVGTPMIPGSRTSRVVLRSPGRLGRLTMNLVVPLTMSSDAARNQDLRDEKMVVWRPVAMVVSPGQRHQSLEDALKRASQHVLDVGYAVDGGTLPYLGQPCSAEDDRTGQMNIATYSVDPSDNLIEAGRSLGEWTQSFLRRKHFENTAIIAHSRAGLAVRSFMQIPPTYTKPQSAPVYNSETSTFMVRTHVYLAQVPHLGALPQGDSPFFNRIQPVWPSSRTLDPEDDPAHVFFEASDDSGQPLYGQNNGELAALNGLRQDPQGNFGPMVLRANLVYSTDHATPYAETLFSSGREADIAETVGDGIVPTFSQLGRPFNPNLDGNPDAWEPLFRAPTVRAGFGFEFEVPGSHRGYMEILDVHAFFARQLLNFLP